MPDDALWPLAAALWRRECETHQVDPDDPRLVGCLARMRGESGELAIAGVPHGTAGIAWLAEQYLARADRATRSRHGRFYTPPGLAATLADRALRAPLPPEGLIVDPACGAGALLAAVVERLVRDLSPEHVVALVCDRVRGTDLDETAVELCELAVRVAVLPAWARTAAAARRQIPTIARVADGLSDHAPAALVLANPPFGRIRATPEQRRSHEAVLYGHAHWPTLFLHAAVERLVPGARAAFVIPTSLVGGAYYQRLREYLTEAAPPDWLGFVQQRSNVFHGDVLQEALLATFARGSKLGRVEVEQLAPDGSVSARHEIGTGSWRSRRPWLIARSPDDLDLVRVAASRTHRLKDYGWSVSTGPLVWNRHKDQLFDVGGPGRLPVVWAADVRDGRVDLATNDVRRYVEPCAGQDWLVLSEPAVLVQRTTAPEQPRRLVAGILDRETLARAGGRVVVENHLNVCTWSGEGPLSPRRLQSFLMGDEADRIYRCLTGSVAVSAFELGELPLPDPWEVVSMDDDAALAA